MREVLRGAEALIVSVGNLSKHQKECQLLILAMLKDVHVQGLSLSDRGRVFSLIDSAFKLDLQPQADEFIDGFTSCMDGERDPRNLRTCFALIPKFVAGVMRNDDQKRADALFAVCSCYFPITFTPPPNDTVGITTAMLKADMLECLISHKLFVPAAIDLALDKISSSSSAGRLDSMDLIAALATRYGARVGLAGCARRVWSALRLQMVEGDTDEVVLRARSCLRHVLKEGADEEEREGKGEGPIREILSSMKMQCLVELRTPDEPRCRKSTVALQCAISAHPLTAAEVLPAVIPQLCTGYMDGTNLSDLRRQTFLHVLIECVMSTKAAAISGGVHPLTPFVEEVYTTAVSAVISGGSVVEGGEGPEGPGIEILCELICQGLLQGERPKEAVGHVTARLVECGASGERCKRICVRFASEESTRALVLEVTLPALLQKVAGSAEVEKEKEREQCCSAIAALCVADQGILEAAVPILQSTGGDVLVRTLAVIVCDSSVGHAQRCEYLLLKAVPDLVKELVILVHNSTPTDAARIEICAEIIGYAIRHTSGLEIHKRYAEELLETLYRMGTLDGGALLPLVCAVLCNCEMGVEMGSEANLGALLSLSLEEQRTKAKGRKSCTEALCSFVNKKGSMPWVDGILGLWLAGDLVNLARKGDAGAVCLIGCLAKACLMRGHEAGGSFVDVLNHLLGGDSAGVAAVAYAHIVADTKACFLPFLFLLLDCDF